MSLLTHKPRIIRPVPPVKGDVLIDIKTPDTPDNPELQAEVDEYSELLNKAIGTDAGFDNLRKSLEEHSRPLRINITPDDHPILSAAISKLTDGQQNSVIDYNTFDKSLRIMNNAFLTTYGFEPSQMLFAKSTPDGMMVPRVNFPESMTCDDIANFDLNAHQDPTQEQSLQSATEQRMKQSQVGLLAILFKMLLAFGLQLGSKMIKKSKLEKVPVAGRTVKWIRVNLHDKPAEKLMAWIKKGQTFDNDSVADGEMSAFFKDIDSIAAGSNSECVTAAAQVIKHTVQWAAASESSQLTQAILMRPNVDHWQDLHEANKFNLDISLPSTMRDDERAEQLRANTRRRVSYANRYYNRSVRN